MALAKDIEKNETKHRGKKIEKSYNEGNIEE